MSPMLTEKAEGSMDTAEEVLSEEGSRMPSPLADSQGTARGLEARAWGHLGGSWHQC